MAELNLDYYKRKLTEEFTLSDFQHFTDIMEQTEWGLHSESLVLQKRYYELINSDSGNREYFSIELKNIENRLLGIILEAERLISQIDLYTLDKKEFFEKIDNSNQPVLVAFTSSNFPYSNLTLKLPIVLLNEFTEGKYNSYILNIEQNESILDGFGMERYSAFYVFLKNKLIGGTFQSRDFIKLSLWYDAIINNKLSELNNGQGTVLLTVSDVHLKEQKEKEEKLNRKKMYDKASEELSAIKEIGRKEDYCNLMKKYYFMFDAIFENGFIIPNLMFKSKCIADFAIVKVRRILNKPEIQLTLIIIKTPVFDEINEFTNSFSNTIQSTPKLMEELYSHLAEFRDELKQQLVSRELELLGTPDINGMYRSVLDQVLKTGFFLGTLILINETPKYNAEDKKKMSSFNKNEFSFGVYTYDLLFSLWRKKTTYVPLLEQI